MLNHSDVIVNPFAGRDVNWLLDFRAETRGHHTFLIWEPFAGERRQQQGCRSKKHRPKPL